MDKRKISEEVYEQYIDASVALFMEYYAAACLDGSEEPRTDETEFPAELDVRCRALINRECRRQRQRMFLKSAGKCLGAVACLAAFLLSLSSVLFMTVEAVRVPIINYYIEQGDGYWEIAREEDHASIVYDVDSIILNDPLAGLIPEDYTLQFYEYISINDFAAIYENPLDDKIVFSAQPINRVSGIDSEDAHISKTIGVGGYSASLVIEAETVRLMWISDDMLSAFTLVISQSSGLDIVGVAEAFILMLNNT